MFIVFTSISIRIYNISARISFFVVVVWCSFCHSSIDTWFGMFKDTNWSWDRIKCVPATLDEIDRLLAKVLTCAKWEINVRESNILWYFIGHHHKTVDLLFEHLLNDSVTFFIHHIILFVAVATFGSSRPVPAKMWQFVIIHGEKAIYQKTWLIWIELNFEKGLDTKITFGITRMKLWVMG